MSRLFKRGNTYWFDFTINGTRYRKTTCKTKRREAEAVLEDEKEKAKAGECSHKIKDCKVAELAKDYLSWVENQKAFKSKRAFIRQIIEVFGNINVKDLDTKKIEKWQSNRLKHNKPATVNRVLACLKHMITKAVDWKNASEETLKRVRKVKYQKENNKRLRFLDMEECQRLIACCSEHLKPIVTIALHTGMRRGEILSLKWSQVDLVHNFILLTDTKNNERREIPIDTTLEYIFREMPHNAKSKYVFAGKSQSGNPITDTKHSFSTALKKAGINDFRFHDLRHTFASQLVMNAIDLTTVKELLGHKTLTMTLRYAHLAPGHKRKAVNTLDKLMQNSTDDVLSLRHNQGTVVESENANGTKMAQFQENDKACLS